MRECKSQIHMGQCVINWHIISVQIPIVTQKHNWIILTGNSIKLNIFYLLLMLYLLLKNLHKIIVSLLSTHVRSMVVAPGSFAMEYDHQ